MNNVIITKKFIDSELRIDSIIHIGTMCCHSSISNSAEDAFDDDFTDVMRALGFDEDALDEMVSLDRGEIFKILKNAGKLGFLVRAATPIPEFISASSSNNASWGYYATKWFYADTYDEVTTLTIDWVATEYERQKIAQGF